MKQNRGQTSILFRKSGIQTTMQKEIVANIDGTENSEKSEFIYEVWKKLKKYGIAFIMLVHFFLQDFQSSNPHLPEVLFVF